MQGGSKHFLLLSVKKVEGLNPSQVEGLIPLLEAVCSTYPHDLSSKGLLGPNYPDVVAILFDLVTSLLSII